jgi:FkbM family methyltransferase
VRLGDPVDRSVYLYGSYEYRVVSLFIQLIQPGMTVVDGGAYHGLYTLLAAKRVGVAGRVLAIEPHPASRERLEANVARNRFENVVVFPGALADAKGEAALRAPTDYRWLGESSLRPDRQERRAQSSISVVTERLDALLELVGRRPLDIVKLDVEGLEAEALRGGRMAISRDYPAIILEVNDLHAAHGVMSAPALDLLRDWGYRIHAISINRLGKCSLEELPSGRDPRPYREPWLALNLVGLHPASRGSGAMIR